MSETITNAAPAAPQQRKIVGRPFAKGVSGNPRGRAPGSRNRLATDLVDAVAADFAQHGAAVIERVRIERPGEYLRCVIDMLPRDVRVAASLDINIDATSFVERFRQALALLHGEQSEQPMKVISGRSPRSSPR